MNLDDATQIADVINKLCGAIVPILVLLFAIRESPKWRRELIGKNQVELAQRVGRLAKRFELQYRHVINPATYSNEYENRPSNENEKVRPSLEDEKFARQKRLEGLFKIIGELYEANIEAEIIFDKNLDEFLEPCGKSAHELSFALHTYFDFQERYPNTTNERLLSQIEQAHNKIYGGNKKSLDEVCNATNGMIKYAKSFVKS